MKTLELHSLGEIDRIASPHSNGTGLHSPAVQVFTDFCEYHPFDLPITTGAREAIRLMQLAHVHLKFVVDEAGHFAGVVSTRRMNEQEIVQKQAQGHAAADLTVADFMKPKAELLAIDYTDLLQATVADVLQVLKSHARPHCLVVDPAQGHIRGIISSSEIIHKLGLSADDIGAADFIDVFQAMRPSDLDAQRELVARTIA